MSRLGLLHPSTLTGKHMADTKALYDAFSAHTNNVFSTNVTTKLATTAALTGPFGILLHTPRVGRAFLDLASALHELPGLDPRIVQMICFTVAAQEAADYELYVHEKMAQLAGVTPEELDLLLSGQCPEEFSEQERAAWQIAMELSNASGPLSRRAWEDAIIAFGRQGALAVVQWVAFCRYVSSIARGFDAQIPAERERVERA